MVSGECGWVFVECVSVHGEWGVWVSVCGV